MCTQTSSRRLLGLGGSLLAQQTIESPKKPYTPLFSVRLLLPQPSGVHSRAVLTAMPQQQTLHRPATQAVVSIAHKR